jgi:hypothetical protein
MSHHTPQNSMSFYNFVVTKELYEFSESMFFLAESHIFIQNMIHVMPNFLALSQPIFFLFHSNGC